MGIVKISYEKLIDITTRILEGYVISPDANLIAKVLVEADAMGISSHGVAKLPGYIKTYDMGLVSASTDMLLLNETLSAANYDAGNGWGQVAADLAMRKAVEKARQTGVGVVGVRNSNHFGVTAYYTNIAAEVGCIGFAITNTAAVVVPFGSLEPSLGTNPIAISIPRGNGQDPVVLDIATSNAARGKIIRAAEMGQEIPADWAVTKEGRETRNAQEALEGYLLPMAGAKGSGLAMMVDILCGVMTGAGFGTQIPRMFQPGKPQNLGHLFGAVDIKAFMDLDEFFARMDKKTAETVGSKPREGVERVLMPGEVEFINRRKSIEQGICLSSDIYLDLKGLALNQGFEI